jgi:hypothetical protein
MADMRIEISPQELLTRFNNIVQVTIEGYKGLSPREVSLRAECRLIVRGAAREAYLLSEKKYTSSDLPSMNPLRLQWDIEINRKGPITFSAPGFSIVYNAIIAVMDESGQATRKELSFRVIPGRISQEEIIKEHKNMTS